MTTAAAVIIGDEILTGKVTDQNTPALIAMLREVGVALRRIAVIGDDEAEIAAEVRRAADHHDYVFTSGGVGPTHDDRTMAGIARAFGVSVVRHPDLVAMLERALGDALNEAGLKMAEVPDGATLCDPEAPFPTVCFRNVFILPGIPRIFAAKLAQIRPRLRGRRAAVARIYVSAYETDIAEPLGRVAAEVPEARIGSYPRIDAADYRVLVTVEHEDEPVVSRAVARLLALLPADRVLRVEGPGG